MAQGGRVSVPSLKTRLKNGETLYGIVLCSFSPTIAEIAGLAGYDFVAIDMEHGPGGISDALPCLRALAATRTPAILRVPETSATWAKKALDLGPQGIMFPLIDGAKSARDAVSYCRYPPKGVRGCAYSYVRASGYGIDEGYLSNHEDELLIMCQVETADGVKNVEEIAAVDGVDCIQIGPLDLIADLGLLHDRGNKKVKEMMTAAEKGSLKKKPADGGAYLSGIALQRDTPESLKSRGYHMFFGAADILMFRNAAVENVKKFKMSLVKGSEDDNSQKDGEEK